MSEKLKVVIVGLLVFLNCCASEDVCVVKPPKMTAEMRVHECYDRTEHGIWEKRTFIDASQVLCRASMKGGAEMWGSEDIVKGTDVLESECDRAWPPRSE